MIDYRKILGDQIKLLSQQSRSFILVNQDPNLEAPGSNQQYWISNKIDKKCSNSQESLEIYKNRVEAFDSTQENTIAWKEFKYKLSYTLVIVLNILKGKFRQQS